MNNFFKKQREWIVLVAYIGVVLVLVYFVIRPLLFGIRNINDQIQKEKLNQEIKINKLKNFPKLKEEYEMLLSDGKKIDILLDSKEAVVLIERLEKLAEDNTAKITISVIEASATVKKTAASTKKTTVVDDSLLKDLPAEDYMQIKVDIVGKYDSIVNFINSLENLEYYSDIINLQVSELEPSDKKESNMEIFDSLRLNLKDDEKITNTNDILKTSINVVFYTKK
jgi:hypothetical protein